MLVTGCLIFLAKMKLFSDGEVIKERAIVRKDSRDTQITLKKSSK